MRALRAALLVLFAVPGSALAAPTMVVRDLPLDTARQPAGLGTQARFNLVGLHWQGPGTVRFRTRGSAGAWSGWHNAAPEGEDQPNAGSPETARARGWRLGNPFWTGSADRIDLRVSGYVRRVRGYFVWSPLEQAPPRSGEIVGSPAIVTRAQWGANEAIRRGSPWYAPKVGFAIVHHTAGSNSYGPNQSSAIVRGIELYHVSGNGWNDIGYNFLVDRYGQVFEGRYGGVDRNVVGAHAEGFNFGSAGVAVIGNYGSRPISAAARTALVKLLAWRLDVAHVDPRVRLTWTSNGNPRYAAGREVSLRAISGHRDTGPTSCPGNVLYGQLPAIGASVAATGLPKLYSPVVTGSVGGAVRFTATLSAPLSWTVTVVDGLGRTVASGAGQGTAVDWRWDATRALPGRYRYAIQAGASVRPATGTVGGGAAVVLPVLSEARAVPATLAPGVTGQPATATVSYRLALPATVTATLVDARGNQVTTLLAGEAREQGVQSFLLDASGLPDGTYGVALAAQADDGNETQTAVSLRVDRAGVALAVSPRLFSPNGDGRIDTARFTYRVPWQADASLQLTKAGSDAGTVFAGPLAAGPQQLDWNGLVNGARARDGAYSALLTLTQGAEAITHAVSLRIDTASPQLRVVSRRPLRIRVNEPATLDLVVNGKRSRRAVHAGVVVQPVRGRLRTLQAIARDAAGNASRILRLPTK